MTGSASTLGEGQWAVMGLVTFVAKAGLGECLRRSADLGRIPVRDVMTKELVVCVPDDDVDYAMGIVTKNRVRHLPIMDGDRVAGLISIGDLVKAGLEEAEYENRYLKEYIQSR